MRRQWLSFSTASLYKAGNELQLTLTKTFTVCKLVDVSARAQRARVPYETDFSSLDLKTDWCRQHFEGMLLMAKPLSKNGDTRVVKMTDAKGRVVSVLLKGEHAGGDQWERGQCASIFNAQLLPKPDRKFLVKGSEAFIEFGRHLNPRSMPSSFTDLF